MPRELLREIKIPYILELLAEKFDDATDLMCDSSLVYGGALRDILADLPIGGDLDIVSKGRDYTYMMQRFLESPKWTKEGWTPTRPSPQGAKTNTNFGRNSFGDSFGARAKSPKPFAHSKKDYRNKGLKIGVKTKDAYRRGGMKIEATVSFLTFDDAKVQLIKSKIPAPTNFESAIEAVKNVDIVCCGIAMDRDGRIFEVVEGAQEDCVGRILRLNKIVKNVNIANLERRITKLTKRGWVSKINIKRLRQQQKKAEKARKEEELRVMNVRKRQPVDSGMSLNSWLALKPRKAGSTKSRERMGDLVINEELLYKHSINRKKIIAVAKRFVDSMQIKAFKHHTKHGILYISVDCSTNVALKLARNIILEINKLIAASSLERSSVQPIAAAKRAHVPGRPLGPNTKLRSQKYFQASETVKHATEECEERFSLKECFSSGGVRSLKECFSSGGVRSDHMFFKALVAHNGQISIEPDDRDLGRRSSETVKSINSGLVTIDVSALPLNVVKMLKQLIDNAMSGRLEDIRTTIKNFNEPELVPRFEDSCVEVEEQSAPLNNTEGSPKGSYKTFKNYQMYRTKGK